MIQAQNLSEEDAVKMEEFFKENILPLNEDAFMRMYTGGREIRHTPRVINDLKSEKLKNNSR